MVIFFTIICYFIVLYLLSRYTVKDTNNASFFHAGHNSKWYLVSFGMIGASISGVSFVSVPGMVLSQDMSYIQTCIGFIFGYIIIAFVLLPLYYRLKLISIYTYLEKRFGICSYKTGASFFLISKLSGSAVKFYVVCIILQEFVLNSLGIPFPVTVICLVLLIWIYSHRGGIKTLVCTDTFQTICMLLALVFIVGEVISALNLNLSSAISTIFTDAHSKIFIFDNWKSPHNFWKDFLSGIFIVVVMTGLDQDMMQKNLTCKSLRDAQKDMCSYGLAFLPINFLFLSLGILLSHYLINNGYTLPEMPDNLMLNPIAGGMLGNGVLILFTIGVVAACFSTADSTLTSLTTSFCIDICNKKHDEKLRKFSHIGISILFIIFILIFKAFNSNSLITTVYMIVSYTYGPLLGLFAYGLFTKRNVNDKLVPFICVISPICCYLLDTIANNLYGYKFGYDLLMLNGILTFIGLWISNSIKLKFYQ